MHRAMGFAKAHQQRPRADRAHANVRRAQGKAGQHRGRSTHAQGRWRCRHLVAAAAGQRRGDGARLDECDHQRRSLRQGVLRKLLPRFRGTQATCAGIPARARCRVNLVQSRGYRQGCAHLRHHSTGYAGVGQRHRPTRQQHVPGHALALNPDGDHRQSRRAGRQRVLRRAQTQLPGTVG